MLLWKRYGNNKMVAMRYYQFTIDAYACSFHVNCKKKKNNNNTLSIHIQQQKYSLSVL